MRAVLDSATPGLPTVESAGARAIRRTVLKDLYQLTKPGITRLVVLTTAVGFYVASPQGALDIVLLLHTLLGTALVASAAGALNHHAERDADALMSRTSDRPIPAGRIPASAAVWFGYGLCVMGLVYLFAFVDLVTCSLVAASFASYVYLYTPLKRMTSASTIVGTIPGGLPIVAGWTAAGGPLDLRAATLFAIMALWQIPHFLALAWIYREDYRRAGMVMLSVVDFDGRQTAGQVVNYAIGLLGVSLLPTVLGMTGSIYFAGALILGAAFLSLGVALMRDRNDQRARTLFFGSVLYLPLLLVLMAVDKVGG
ncbi:MAG TPA: heme o synthase [Longimicrobiales bacterium]|nr:heme o synthase [Longimicrobiales bacterium]